MLMKCFLLLVTLSSYAAILAKMPIREEYEEKKPLCTKEQCGKQNAKTCRCYCSVKCGPREIKPEDTPKYDDDDQQCFCAPRDKYLYKINGCKAKEEAKKEE